MKKLIIILLVLMVGCKTAKVVEGNYAFYIKDWKCDKSNNLMMLLKGYPDGNEFWIMEIKNGKPKKCGECDESYNYK